MEFRSWRVYPRACGGTPCAIPKRPWWKGLSPRVRGNLGGVDGPDHHHGSIPARAGEPIGEFYHPHVHEGLSPRVRGNLTVEAANELDDGSIPARAGEPDSAAAVAGAGRVYPRACGGTEISVNRRYLTTGLSPRVRGNRERSLGPAQLQRSIPARAGEPFVLVPRLWLGKVYPRACGGTIQFLASEAIVSGLSPRVRGNPTQTHPVTTTVGSIPARAGEPLRPRPTIQLTSVYPRACGGTTERQRRQMLDAGLSPRVRGNPDHGAGEGDDARSIPARAGEPLAN